MYKQRDSKEELVCKLVKHHPQLPMPVYLHQAAIV